MYLAISTLSIPILGAITFSKSKFTAAPIIKIRLLFVANPCVQAANSSVLPIATSLLICL
jgi:hypothetical protein